MDQFPMSRVSIKSMKTIVTVLIVFLALLAPSVAFACDEGDVMMGPNCIHSEVWEVSAAAGHTGPLYKLTAYRTLGNSKWVLWSQTVGEIVESTKVLIRTTTRFEYDDGRVSVIDEVYYWNGRMYR